MIPNIPKIYIYLITLSLILFTAMIGYAQEELPMPPPPDMGGEMGGDTPMPPPPVMEDVPMDAPPEDAMDFDAQNQDQSSSSSSNSNQSGNLSQVTIIRPETHSIQKNTDLDYSRFTTQLEKGLDKNQLTLLSQATANLTLTKDEAIIILPKILAILKYRSTASQKLQLLRAKLQELISSGKTTEALLKPPLTIYKMKLAEIERKLTTMEYDLCAVLTFKQEAQLTLNGVLTNGMRNSTVTYTSQPRTRRRTNNN